MLNFSTLLVNILKLATTEIFIRNVDESGVTFFCGTLVNGKSLKSNMFSTINYFVITALLCSVVSSGSVDNDWDSAKIPLSNENLHSKRVRLLGEDAFNVDFEFPPFFANSYRSIFKSQFMEAAKLISDSIFIYSTININFVFEDDDTEILAKCAPTVLGTRNEGKKQYLSHPLALIKQSPSFQNSNVPDHDMRIVFYLNNILEFWFGDEQMYADQFDFRLVIAHEIIYGLGFGGSSLIEWKIQRNDLGKPLPFLAKRPRMNIEDKCFHRTYVFTHNLVGEDNVRFPFPDLINRIVLDSKDKNSYEYFNGIGASEDALNAGSLLHRSKLFFQIKSGKLIDLEGTHIMKHNSRFDYDYNSPDFMMFEKSIKGVTVESQFKVFHMQSIIGPNLKNILETLGWRFDKQEYDEITIDERENSKCATDADGNIITFKD